MHEDGDYVVCDDGNARLQKCPKAGTGACTTVAGNGNPGVNYYLAGVHGIAGRRAPKSSKGQLHTDHKSVRSLKHPRLE